MKHCPWGGAEAILSLLGLSNPGRKPFAELWLGARRNSPSLMTVCGGRMRLDEHAAADPSGVLGNLPPAKWRSPWTVSNSRADSVRSSGSSTT